MVQADRSARSARRPRHPGARGRIRRRCGPAPQDGVVRRCPHGGEARMRDQRRRHSAPLYAVQTSTLNRPAKAMPSWLNGAMNSAATRACRARGRPPARETAPSGPSACRSSCCRSDHVPEVGGAEPGTIATEPPIFSMDITGRRRPPWNSGLLIRDLLSGAQARRRRRCCGCRKEMRRPSTARSCRRGR